MKFILSLLCLCFTFVNIQGSDYDPMETKDNTMEMKDNKGWDGMGMVPMMQMMMPMGMMNNMTGMMQMMIPMGMMNNTMGMMAPIMMPMGMMNNMTGMMSNGTMMMVMMMNQTASANNTTTQTNYNMGDPSYGNITRPCSSGNLNCIRKFLSDHSNKCLKTYSSVPDPLVRKQSTNYIPRLNVTLTGFYEVSSGTNPRINDFFVNNDTDKVVLVLDYRDLQTTDYNSLHYIVHRRAKEPIVIKTNFNATFTSLVLTVIIPKRYDLDFKRMVVYPYYNDPNNPFTFGPEVTTSTIPEVQATVVSMNQNPSVIAREYLLTAAPYYAAQYITHALCDFGYKIY